MRIALHLGRSLFLCDLDFDAYIRVLGNFHDAGLRCGGFGDYMKKRGLTFWIGARIVERVGGT